MLNLTHSFSIFLTLTHTHAHTHTDTHTHTHKEGWAGMFSPLLISQAWRTLKGYKRVQPPLLCQIGRASCRERVCLYV